MYRNLKVIGEVIITDEDVMNLITEKLKADAKADNVYVYGISMDGQCNFTFSFKSIFKGY